AEAPVLVFSDANSMYKPDALWKLARWMKREEVGCVCGRLYYRKTAEHHAEKGEIKYWDWDTRLKIWEGRSGHLLGANGAIFALRKNLALELPGNQSNDMILPIIARLRGCHAVYDPDAVAVEKTAESVSGEFHRKARIIARGLNGVIFILKFALRHISNSSASLSSVMFVLFQLICKKFFRYLAFPAFFLMLWMGLLTYPGITFTATLFMWGFILLCLLINILYPAGRKLWARWPNLSYPLAMAWAGCVGFWIFITGRTMSQWKSRR
ncbi:glycosyltransferase, partial [Candidatus Sumerlaeota bacterium]|nr:glycosyltransferase [Candidatus Sumerlaeota bacterium]